MQRPRTLTSENPDVTKQSPIEEFTTILTRLDTRIIKLREVYRDSLIPPAPPETQNSSSIASFSSAATVRGLGARWFGRKTVPTPTAPQTPSKNEIEASLEPATPRLTPDPIIKKRNEQAKQNRDPVADFVPLHGNNNTNDETLTVDSFVEDLRRVAEMCIIGENFVTKAENKKVEKFKKQQEQWIKARNELDDIMPSLEEHVGDDSERELDITLNEEKMQLFDLFFEMNGLEMIVNFLTGKSFQLTPSEKLQILRTTSELEGPRAAGTDVSPATASNMDGSTQVAGQTLQSTTSSAATLESPDTDSPEHPCNKTMLPPLAIAIQALQSISILIQNVSRATSLFVILSNNHINELISLPLNLYSIAEQRRQRQAKEVTIMPSYTSQASSSVAELTTHFVTFLKSLAMRMNAQTLQFFLTYPIEQQQNDTIRRMLASSQQKRTPNKHKKAVRRTKSTDVKSASTARWKSNNRSRSEDLQSIVTSLDVLVIDSDAKSTTLATDSADAQRPKISDSDKERFRNNRENSGSFDDNDEGLALSTSDDLGDKQNDSYTTERDIKFVAVQFPLYERALEFCAPIHDNFVRLTAMNICLNTLRLITVDESESEEIQSVPSGSPEKSMSSPDGVLHNAEGLPFPERLAIAQFTCIPSRVERLIAPIFTKIAERWNAIEEQISKIDANKHMGYNRAPSNLGDNNSHRVKEFQRLIRGFKDKAADLQDDLFMLEDVFKVGMTVLNEQCIEMMLATIIYPLLLQPLLIYYKEFVSSVDESRFSFTDHPFGGVGVDLSDIDKSLLPVACPAKAALFTIGCIFQSISNRPLLRLLFTLLLHPLSPDSTKAPTVRGKLEVATITSDGRKFIRVDKQQSSSNERSTYAFGTLANNRRRSKAEIQEAEDDEEACVFVLAPALAEVLESTGNDNSLMTRCASNPYRRAFLKCLRVPGDMSDIRELATCTIDAVLSMFDGKFISDIVYGLHDEVSDVAGESCKDEGENAHQVQDVVAALVDCSVTAKRVASNDWKVEYDKVGAHALLSAIRRSPVAIRIATAMIEQRREKSAAILADRPSCGLVPMGGSNVDIPGSPSVNDSDFEERMFDVFIDHVFYDSLDLTGTPIAETELLQLKSISEDVEQETFSIDISIDGTSEALMNRVGTFLVGSVESDDISITEPFEKMITSEWRDGVRALLRLDALAALCKDLSATDGYAIRDGPFSGVAFSPNGSCLTTNTSNHTRGLVSPLSTELKRALFTVGNGTIPLPIPLSEINLANCGLLPCVCEAPASSAHLFADDVSGVVAEGVTWQSLYIVFVDECLVFAQPIPGQTGGIGRVISSCGLAQVIVQVDPGPVQQGGPARRLLLSHKWFDKTPPPLFLFDHMPDAAKESPPFVHVKTYTSRLDVWFEHQRAADHAFSTLTNKIFQAKVQRGMRLQSFLHPQEGCAFVDS